MKKPLPGLRAVFPMVFALVLAACGGGGGGDEPAPLTPSGRMPANLPVSGDAVPGIWASNTSGGRLMGIEFLGAGTATYRRAETDDDGVPAALASGRWRIVDNVLIFKGANQGGQDECSLTSVSESTATLSCLTVGGPDDGTPYDWFLSPVDLPEILLGSWTSELGTATFTDDGRYTAMIDGETLTGTWSISGIRLTLSGLARCDFAGAISADNLFLTCRASGDPEEGLTFWTRSTAGASGSAGAIAP